jgi:hypothetical protein
MYEISPEQAARQEGWYPERADVPHAAGGAQAVALQVFSGTSRVPCGSRRVDLKMEC